MKSPVGLFAVWCSAVLVASLPWIYHWQPHWAPAIVAVALLVRLASSPRESGSPLPATPIAVSCATFLVFTAGWTVAGVWIALAALVGAAAAWLPRKLGRGRPDAADLLALVGWAAVPLLDPSIMEVAAGGWLAPAILLLAARRLARFTARASTADHIAPAPPSRAARGTLSLRGVVLEADGLPRSVPIDLELRAGDSLAVLCNTSVDGEAFANVISGRRKPREGEVAVDAVPLEAGDRLVTVIGSGERFLGGDIEVNVCSLCEEDLEPTAIAAIGEACALDEVLQELGDRQLSADGSPLAGHHRLLLLAARVIPSQYRVVVVIDPVSWLNAVQGELWRAAVVRASVGRTAVWITTDRDLASRASQVMQLRHGALRPFEDVDRGSG